VGPINEPRFGAGISHHFTIKKKGESERLFSAPGSTAENWQQVRIWGIKHQPSAISPYP